MSEVSPSTSGAATAASLLPAIIQGGMGAAVSNWRLAKAVSLTGSLGVVSGTAIDRVLACRLQDGDPEGDARRILARFPFPEMAQRVLKRWFVPGGLAKPGAYGMMPLIDHQPTSERQELLVVASFVEVALAKEGHAGAVGINLLEKLQSPNLALLYGAMLAGVDAVLMGAGIPREIPGALDRLARHEEASLVLRVEGALPGEITLIRFVPLEVVGPGPHAPLRRPPFLAIVSSDILAQSLVRSASGMVDGFVVEGPTAGGHNAPPRDHGKVRNERGEPIYGPRDAADLGRMVKLGRPFWLAGGYGTRDGLARARAVGAHGVQMGTVFALSEESGLAAPLKAQILALLRGSGVEVYTDPAASPTGFPFKVAQVPGTLSEAAVYAARKRICNLGYLRQAYRRPDGTIGWRCAAEPEDQYLAKGGDPALMVGCKCLCNGLLASAGHALLTKAGVREPAIVTAGDGLSTLATVMPNPDGYRAAEVVRPG